MPNVYIIIGNAKTRKSSTIRALTGVYRSIMRRVAISTVTTVNMFVQVISLQEDNISSKKIIEKHNSDEYILLSLRLNHANGLPSGLDYINDFLSNHWNIQQIVVLGHAPQTIAFPNQITNINSFWSINDNTATNSIANQIRRWWGWL